MLFWYCQALLALFCCYYKTVKFSWLEPVEASQMRSSNTTNFGPENFRRCHCGLLSVNLVRVRRQTSMLIQRSFSTLVSNIQHSLLSLLVFETGIVAGINIDGLCRCACHKKRLASWQKKTDFYIFSTIRNSSISKSFQFLVEIIHIEHNSKTTSSRDGLIEGQLDV